MARRHELTDAQWDLIEGCFPGQGRGGRWSDHRTAFDGMLWRLRTGAPGRDLPERHGPRQAAYRRYNALRRTGTLERILGRLQARLNAEGLIDPDLFCVGGTSVRASRSAAGASKRSRWPRSRPTTPWAARAAASARRCTRPATAAACRRRWPSRGASGRSARSSRR